MRVLSAPFAFLVLLPFLGCDSQSTPWGSDLDYLRVALHCPVEAIEVGRPINESLATGDCHVHGDASPFIDWYGIRITEAEAGMLRITMSSSNYTAVDPYLVYRRASDHRPDDPPSTFPGGENDDIDLAAGLWDAQITAQFPAGLYAVGARSSSLGQSGPYTIEIERM